MDFSYITPISCIKVIPLKPATDSTSVLLSPQAQETTTIVNHEDCTASFNKMRHT